MNVNEVLLDEVLARLVQPLLQFPGCIERQANTTSTNNNFPSHIWPVSIIVQEYLSPAFRIKRVPDEEELNVRPGDLSNRFACLRAIFENVFDGGRDIRVGLKRQFAYIVIIGVEVGTGIDG